MLTKRDCEKLADAIAIDYAEPRSITGCDAELRNDLERSAIRRTAEAVANVCAESNARFDRAKFLARACPEMMEA